MWSPEPAALVLCHAAPYPVLLAGAQRELTTGSLDRATSAHGEGFGYLPLGNAGGGDREEQVRVGQSAGGSRSPSRFDRVPEHEDERVAARGRRGIPLRHTHCSVPRQPGRTALSVAEFHERSLNVRRGEFPRRRMSPDRTALDALSGDIRQARPRPTTC